MWLKLRNVEEKMFVLSSSLKFQTPISSSRAPDPFLFLGDPGLLLNLPRNWLSHFFFLECLRDFDKISDILYWKYQILQGFG